MVISFAQSGFHSGVEVTILCFDPCALYINVSEKGLKYNVYQSQNASKLTVKYGESHNLWKYVCFANNTSRVILTFRPDFHTYFNLYIIL